jgi:putative ABC transport system permease protein
VDIARVDLKQIAARLAELYPDQQKGRSVLLRPLHEDVAGRVRPALLTLMGAVGFVLLIACANVANLMLARAAGRGREIAVRIALGASRARLMRQLLTESVLLSLAGGAVGVLLAYGGLQVLLRLGANQIPRSSQIAIDPTVLLFLVAVSLITGILFGLAPALAVLRPEVMYGLRQGARGSVGTQQQGWRRVLIAGEFALALVLLVGAGLLIKSFLLLNSTSTGLRAGNVVTSRVSVPASKYPQGSAARLFYGPVLDRVEAIPGVRAAGFISNLPLQSWGSNGDFEIEGRPASEMSKSPFAEFRLVSSGYFRALGIPLLHGRDVSAQDTVGSMPVILVNEALATRYFPGEDPVGRKIRAGSNQWQTIVGIVGSVRQAGLDRNPIPEVYLPTTQLPDSGWMSEMSLVVSGSIPPENLASSIRTAVHTIDPNQPIYRVKTMERVIADSLSDRRLYLWLLVIFAAIALVLASAGIYGVMSYLVAQRTQEFGVRMALGARAWDVLRMVLRQALTLVLAGMVVGVAVALAVTRVLSSLLYGVSPQDTTIFATVPLVLAAVALAAAWTPAFRATRVDPTVALRYE